MSMLHPDSNDDRSRRFGFLIGAVVALAITGAAFATSSPPSNEIRVVATSVQP